MKLTLRVALISLSIAAAAFAQLSSNYVEFGEGPAVHLMTKDEIRQWKAIRTDGEALAFIDLFWARRDPTPATPQNEFREEFGRRVEAADRYFSSAKKRGAMSDPGKVLILLGPPLQVSGKGPIQSESSPGVGRVIPEDANGQLALPEPRTQGPRQVWTYAHDHKPKWVQQDRLVLVFSDEGQNEWELAMTERTNPNAFLQQAVNALIVSPDLKKAPVFAEPVKATEFKTQELKKRFEEFRSSQKEAVGPTALTWNEFLAEDGKPFVAVQLYAPEGSGLGSGQKVTFFSVVENAKGEVLQVDENATAMIASGSEAYVDRSLQLEPGTYTGTFGLAGVDGTITAVRRVPMTVEPIDPAAHGISPLILSTNVYPLQADPGLTEPFTFGRLKVVPKGDSQFAPKGDLWYFAELRNPGLNDQGSPSIQVKVDISGKTAKGPAAMNFPLGPAEVVKLNAANTRYAVGVAIPMEGFPPGEYTIKVRVVDSLLSKTYDLEKAFKVKG